MKLVTDIILLVNSTVLLIRCRFKVVPANPKLLFSCKLTYGNGNAIDHKYIFPPFVEYYGKPAVNLFCPGG